MLEITLETRATLNSLQRHAEFTEEINGETWGTVYLPNVHGHKNTLRFAGQVSILKQAGWYCPVDSFFGRVKF
jgi:hypothetical protein